MGGVNPPATGDQAVRQMAKDINYLKRRGSGYSGRGDMTVTRVTASGVYGFFGLDTTEAGPYRWAQGYVPTPGDHAWLVEVNGSLTVAGAVADFFDLPRVVSGVYGNYPDFNANADSFMAPRVYLRNGFVQISGMIWTAVTTAGTTLFTLPEGYRPDYSRDYPVDNSGVLRSITVQADGQVKIGVGWTSSGFATLEAIMYPVAGRATWTFIDPQGTAGSQNAFMNSWVDYVAGGGAWGRAGYWVDEYGFCWYTGKIKNGTLADNIPMFSIPASVMPAKETHVSTCSNDGFGGAGLRPGVSNSVNLKAGSSNVWLSLARVTHPTALGAGSTLNTWRVAGTDMSYLNTWQSYNATQYPIAQYTQRGDGLCFLSGLVSTGTANAAIFASFLQSMGREKIMIHPSIANGAHSRVDIQSSAGPSGDVRSARTVWQANGSNAWLSLDGLKWIPD